VGVPCDVLLTAAPGGEAIDPEFVNVIVTRSDGSPIQLLAVPDASSCTPDGWYFDDWTMPMTLHLCPEACAAATEDRDGHMDLIFGCNGVRADGACFL
jgi:hypothetical protein